MNFLLIGGITLVAVATGLLAFVMLKKDKPKDQEQELSIKENLSASKTATQPQRGARRPSARRGNLRENSISLTTQNFFILCTLIFWMLFIGAGYWAYTKEPLYGLLVGCFAVLIYAVVMILQELLRNIIQLNKHLSAGREEDA